MSRTLPRAVWLLGWVSLATDAATELVYPLLPFFLTRVLQANAVSLGVIEGAAEATNSLLKIWAGRAADRSPRKRPLVVLGYSISSLARPFIAVTTTWMQVFTVRVLDRVGKGIRSAPRDAMLAGWATPATRGRVYGFHRGMDHTGAIIGPIVATVFLFFYPDQYRLLFGLTIIPGAIAVALIFLVPEPDMDRAGLKTRATPGKTETQASTSMARDASTGAAQDAPTGVAQDAPTGVAQDFSPAVVPAPLPRAFNRFMLVLGLFTLGNSTDAFLLLRLTDAAGTVRFVPLMWAALHVVKASVSMAAGSWSDRVGRRTVITIGWLVYTVVYAGFALSTSIVTLFGWFLLYGFYFGFAEGTEKALVADLAPVDRRGFAFGIYNAVTGFGALAASIVFGLVWNAYGTTAAFALGAALALLATGLLFVALPRAEPVRT
jgi:MFS family permease